MVRLVSGGRRSTNARRLIGALISAFVGLGLLVGTAPGAKATTASDEAYVHSKVNEARAGRMSPLRDDGRLDAVAREQAQRMRDQGRIFHNPNNGADADAHGYDWERVGENVGVGPDVADVQQAFMASHTHRANILDARFTDMGVGVAVATNGRVYVAQVFGKLREQPPAPQAAPAAPQATPEKKPSAEAAAANPDAPAEPPPAVRNEPVAEEQPVVPVGHVLLEDGSIVPNDYVVNDPCGAAYIIGYDGTIIPRSFDVLEARC